MFFTVLWPDPLPDTRLTWRKEQEMSLPGKRPVVKICIAIAAISFCALAITHITHAISSSSTSPDSVEEATGYSCHDLEVAHINDIELEGDESLFSHLSGNGESLVLFWSTWCPHCKPVIERLISSPDTANRLLSVVEEPDTDELKRYEGSLPILVDDEWSVFNQYGLEHVPSLLVVDEQGAVLASAEGEEASMKLIDEFEAR